MRYWQQYLLLVVALFSVPAAQARVYMRCELTRELLLKYQINKTFISNWICMIEHESGGDTGKIVSQSNGSSKFGLFQIDDKLYCRKDRKGGYCNKNCKDFLNDNIEDDVECAKLIFEREGFKHWRGWQLFCKNQQNLPNLNVACNINTLSVLSALTYNGFYNWRRPLKMRNRRSNAKLKYSTIN